MSNEAVEKIRPVFANYGIEPLNFYFGSVNTVDDDEGIKKLKTAMAERASMNVMGYNYQQMRSFDVMEAAAKNEGGSGMLNAGVGLGAGMGMGGAIGQMAAQMGQYRMHHSRFSRNRNNSLSRCNHRLIYVLHAEKVFLKERNSACSAERD